MGGPENGEMRAVSQIGQGGKVIVLPLLIVRLMFESFRFNGNCNLLRECYSYGVLLEPKILEIQIAHNPYLARG
jgi:hypothetical protein